MIIDLWCVKFVSLTYAFCISFFFPPPLARRNSVFPLAFSFFIFFVSLLIVYKYGQKRGHGREGEGFLNGQ